MSRNRQIVCACNLLLFVVSFALLALFTLQLKSSSLGSDQVHSSFVQKADGGSLGSFQQINEKEESETESDAGIDIVHFFLPFFVSVLSVTSFFLRYTGTAGGPALQKQPVYLVISNFRI